MKLLPIAQEIFDLSVKAWPDRKVPVTIIGDSPALDRALQKARKFANFDEPVLILGESGTGKELFARTCYLLGERSKYPFVPVNCPQYSNEDVASSELFGHVKGAFTGASSDHAGVFDEAKNGCVFLDEIADLPLPVQVKLLRALAGDGEFMRVGDSKPKQMETRVLAATNRALEELVVEREFRHDLFFRLSFFRLEVPTLRERGNDWRLIAEHFLDDLARRYEIRKDLSDDAWACLEDYNWPGNVRQLNAAITLGYSMVDPGGTIEIEHMAPALSWVGQDLAVSADAKARNGVAVDDAATGSSPEVHVRRGKDGIEVRVTGARRAGSQPAGPSANGGESSAELDCYSNMIEQGMTFWEAVREPFLAREINRREVRWVLEEGLREAGGGYKRLLRLFNIEEGDYQKFMGFLRTHSLKVPRRGRE